MRRCGLATLRLVPSLFPAAVLLALSLQAVAAAPSDAVPAPADTIFVHGVILTGAHLREADTSATPARVSAVAVRQGRLVMVGSDADALRMKGSATNVVDLHGAFAMPGFNDAHTHMAEAGRQRLAVDLVGVRSLGEMQDRIREYVAHAAPGAWIAGGGWDETMWAEKQLPTRESLDAVTAGRPAIFSRVDGHMAVANTAALAAAGIDKNTADPAGAKIDRGVDGAATGVLRESAATGMVFAKVPRPTLAERRKALSVAIEEALAHGVTSVQDNSEWEDFLALEEMEHAGTLKLRVAEWMDFNLPVAVLQSRRAGHPADDPLLHLTQLKGFLDGSLGSRTAAMEEPYADDANNSGLPRYDDQKLNAMAAERAAAGFQIGLHAIGDLANTMALDAFAAAEQSGLPANRPAPPRDPDAAVVTSSAQAVKPADLRLRVEHAQVLLPGDFDRFAAMGVIASMQPSHLLTDMNWAGARLGLERSRFAYAWHTFLDHGVTLAFGTDYPVESIDPFRGLYSAVTRKNEAGTKSFEVGEAISRNEAIFAYTQASAFAEFREGMKGRLEPGMVADMIVVDREITKATPAELLQSRVLRTIVNGETVYQVEAAAVERKKAVGAGAASTATDHVSGAAADGADGARTDETPAMPEKAVRPAVPAKPKAAPEANPNEEERTGTSRPPA